MAKSFYVTLPSNGSMNVHPDNTVTEFRNRLPRPLHLDGDWEVGLANFSYPKTWYQICPETSQLFWRASGQTGLEQIPLQPLKKVTASTIGSRLYLPESKREWLKFDGVDHNGRLKIRADYGKVLLLKGKISQNFGCGDECIITNTWRYA